MSTIHRHLALEDVEAGMVLAEAISNAQGNILLQAGTVLNEAMLQSLQKHRIGVLAILFEVQEQGDPQKRMDEHRKRLQYLFRKHDAEDASPQLLALLLQYRARQAGAEGVAA